MYKKEQFFSQLYSMCTLNSFLLQWAHSLNMTVLKKKCDTTIPCNFHTSQLKKHDLGIPCHFYWDMQNSLECQLFRYSMMQ